jgi:hypothetical protein
VAVKQDVWDMMGPHGVQKVADAKGKSLNSATEIVAAAVESCKGCTAFALKRLDLWLTDYHWGMTIWQAWRHTVA